MFRWLSPSCIIAQTINCFNERTTRFSQCKNNICNEEKHFGSSDPFSLVNPTHLSADSEHLITHRNRKSVNKHHHNSDGYDSSKKQNHTQRNIDERSPPRLDIHSLCNCKNRNSAYCECEWQSHPKNLKNPART